MRSHRSPRVLRSIAGALGPPQLGLPPSAAPAPHDAAAEAAQPSAEYVTAARFEPDDPLALRHLEEEGYTIIKSVLSGAEVEHALELLWAWLAGLGTGIERGLPETWGGEANDAVFTDAGVIATNGAIHSRVAWFCRDRPRVKQA
jgi:hypothetical protein